MQAYPQTVSTTTKYHPKANFTYIVIDYLAQ